MDLPIDFISQLHHLLGVKEAMNLMDSLKEPSPVSIRINPYKVTHTQLSILRFRLDRVPWCENGFYLPERFTFTFDPLWHAGVYYVQEASSMYLEQVVNQVVTTPVLALDLCAAPGGKTTHLRSLLPVGSFLVANEVIRSRAWILAENVTKWGYPDVMVTNNDPADFAGANVSFDFILADVPCSGEGMFRKDEGAISEWSLANVEICRQRQRRVIADIWPCLKPGGMLVYSTCTYNIGENEENVNWIADELGADIMKLPHNPARFFPHKTKGEGFFICALRKHSDETFAPTVKKKSSSLKNKKAQEADETIRSPYYRDEQDVLLQQLRVLQSGILPGTMKGKDFIPSHALAMAHLDEVQRYPRAEVTYEMAISYLRRETIVLDPAAPKGYILLTYKDQALGFVKNLGNRANNLYPQEWRIRSGYLPEEVKVLDI